jgi:hypothetical protein
MHRKIFIGIGAAVGLLAILVPVIAQDRAPAASSPAAREVAEAQQLARIYIKGMEEGKLTALDDLFLTNERSTITENASEEGSWEHYRDHHLAPELKESPGFKVTIEKEKAEALAGAVLVRQFGTFTFAPPKPDEPAKTYRAAISYMIVTDQGRPRIAHLHWSSRAERR